MSEFIIKIQDITKLFSSYSGGPSKDQQRDYDLSKQIISNHFEHYKHNEKSLKAALRHFLKIRWSFIHNTRLSYCEAPNSPLNQICQKIAGALAEPGEPLAKILMPTLEIEYYLAFDTDFNLENNLIEITETVSETGERQLKLNDFIISHDGKAIIPLEYFFDRVNKSTGGPVYEHAYSEYHPEKEFFYEQYTPVPLNKQDIELLKYAALPESKTYIEEDQDKLAGRGSYNLIAAFTKLRKDCQENGAYTGRGTEAVAYSEIYPRLREFFVEWNKAPKTVRNRILELRSAGIDDRTVANFLWVWAAEDKSPVTEQEFNQRRALAYRGAECIEVNSSNIMQIITPHFHTPLFTGQVTYTDPALLRNEIAKKLKKSRTLPIVDRDSKTEQAWSEQKCTDYARKLLSFTDIECLTDLVNLSKAFFESDFHEILSKTTEKKIQDLLLEAARSHEALNQNALNILNLYLTRSLSLQPHLMHFTVSHNLESSLLALLARADSAKLLMEQDKGCNPLHVAVEQGNLKLCEHLCAHSPQNSSSSFQSNFINSKNAQECSPAQMAYENRRLTILKFLISKGGQFQSPTLCLLYLATEHGEALDDLKRVITLQGQDPIGRARDYLAQNCKNPELENAILDELTHSFEQINKMLNQYSDTNQIKAALRCFLRLRWNAIQNTPAAYLAFSESPVNQICQTLASWIALPDESIADILMPSLAPENQALDFPLDTYLLNHDSSTLIPLAVYFEQDQIPGLELTLDDLARLRMSVPPYSELYFQVKENSEHPEFHPLYRLCVAILNNRVDAAMVSQFFNSYWNRLSVEQQFQMSALVDPIKSLEEAALNPQERAMLNDLAVPPLTLEQYLLNLRFLMGLSLSEEENDKRLRLGVMNSWIEIGQALYRIFENEKDSGLLFCSPELVLEPVREAVLTRLRQPLTAFNSCGYTITPTLYCEQTERAGFVSYHDLSEKKVLACESIFKERLSATTPADLNAFLEKAVKKNNRALIDDLVAAKASCPELLQWAIEHQHLDLALKLIKNGDRLQESQEKSFPLMHRLASDSRWLDHLKILMDEMLWNDEADYNLLHEDKTVFERARDSGNNQAARYFIHQTPYFNVNSLMKNPNLDRLCDHHGFEEVCHFAKLDKSSDQALKLYATAEIRRLSRDPVNSNDKITQLENGLETGSKQTLLNALKLHRTYRGKVLGFIGVAPHPQSYNYLPRVLKK